MVNRLWVHRMPVHFSLPYVSRIPCSSIVVEFAKESRPRREQPYDDRGYG